MRRVAIISPWTLVGAILYLEKKINPLKNVKLWTSDGEDFQKSNFRLSP